MGNVKSFCCRDTVSEEDECDDRVRIINDEFGGPGGEYYEDSIHTGISNQDNLSDSSLQIGNDGKQFEQSALDNIYKRMAANLIDVAPDDSMIIQQAEFVDRQQKYQAKLAQIKTQLALKSSTTLNRQQQQQQQQQIQHQNNLNNQTNNNTSSISGDSSTKNISLQANSSSSPTPGLNNSSSSLGNILSQGRLEYEPISIEDIQFINEISLKSAKAVQNVRIISDQPIISHFRP